MPELVSMNEAVRRTGKAKSTILRIVNRCGIKRRKDGRLDFQQITAALDTGLQTFKQRPIADRRRRVRAATPAEAREAVTAVQRLLVEHGHASEINAQSAKIALDIIRGRKEAALAERHEIENLVRSGTLCDTIAVGDCIFKMARAMRDSLMNWPSRVAPIIAAELKADQVQVTLALEHHIREQLETLAAPDALRQQTLETIGASR